MFSSITVFAVMLIKDNALKTINPEMDIGNDMKLILFIFSVLIIFTHRKNISNLKKKTEQKIKI